MPSKDLLEKYEYMTGEELGHRPSLYEKAEFEYSPLGMTLINNTKSKTNENKVYNKNKQDKYLLYNSHIVLQSLKISMNLKNYHLILCTRD